MMETSQCEHNFAACQLGDQRLTRRAFSIGQALCRGFGQALSTVFETAKELKRAYEFSPTRTLVLNSSSPLMAT